MNLQKIFKDAFQAHSKGNFEIAKNGYQQVLKYNKTDSDSLHLLGLIHYQNKNYLEAIEYIEKAIKSNNKVVDFYSNLGLAYANIDNFEKAIINYDKAIRLNKDFIIVYYNKGLSLKKIDKIDEAIENLKKAIELKPNYIESIYELAIIFQDKEELEISLSYFNKLVEIAPKYKDTLFLTATLYRKLKNMDIAIQLLEKSIEFNINAEVCYLALGIADGEKLNFENSIINYKKAIEINKNYVDAYNNLANLYLNIGEYEKAIELYNYIVETFDNKRIKNSAYLGIGTILLSLNNLKDGWIYYTHRDTRVLSNTIDYKTKLELNLKDKRIFIVAEQGLADEIIFMRFVKLLKQRGCYTISNPSKKIFSIVKRMDIYDEVIEDNQENIDNLEFDERVALADLPFLLECNSIESIPKPLELEVEKNIELNIDNNLMTIGINWRSGASHSVHKIDIENFVKIFDDRKYNIIVLQRNIEDDEIEKLENLLGYKVYNYSYLSDDLEGMLSVLSQLNLYIGTDNLNNYLCDTLRVINITLNTYKFDWRRTKQGYPWIDTEIGVNYFQDRKTLSWKQAIKQTKSELKTNTLFKEARDFYKLQEYDKAISIYKNILKVNKDNKNAKYHLSIIYLRIKNLKKAWRLYNNRISSFNIVESSLKIDERLPLDLTNKKIVLLREQGIGDEIFFLRFAKILKDRGAYLYYNPSYKLKSILKDTFIDEIVDDCLFDDKNINPIKYDYRISIGDLPLFLNCNKNKTIPKSLKLNPKADLIQELKLPKDKINIAINWRAGSSRTARKIDLQNFSKIFNGMENKINFIVLQRNLKDGEIEELEDVLGQKVTDYSIFNDDLDRLIALLSLLDCYIGIDTVNHFLCDSLKIKNYVLNDNNFDWRRTEDNKPWFPNTSKSYFQDKDTKSWEDIIFRLNKELKLLYISQNKIILKLDPETSSG